MISSEHLAAIERALAELIPGARLRQASRLEGGMSADLYLLELTYPDGKAFRRVARFPSSYVRTLFADAQRHEAKVLDWVSRAGLPAPRPFGSTDELLLMEWMPGVATARPADPASFVREMATWLARIHQVPLTPEACETLPEASRKFVPTGEANIALREPEIRTAVAKIGATPWPSTCLRHGDFWPGNLLWEQGQCTAIVDWENALTGPPTADLAISRLDVAWILGLEAMTEFTARYEEALGAPAQHLAYWDLRAALRPMKNLPEWVAPYAALHREDITASHLEKILLEFIDQALRAAAS